MAWRLRASVVRGEIDNRLKGRITGKVWLVGRDEPIILKLAGNGYRDVAGSLLVFENPNPQAGDEHNDIATEQVGAIGDYTASRKVRAFDIPIDEALAMIRRGEKLPERMANCLYLEWFSERNGRVVIESYEYETRIEETTWSLESDEEDEQLRRNAESMTSFMHRLGEAIEAADGCEDGNEDGTPPYRPENDMPMDEFQWERFMKESDKRSEKFGELLEKYMDHPDRDRIVAREMGWDELADDLETYDEAVESDEFEPFDWSDEEYEEPQPNPLTEGIDWIRDEYGHPVHPLQHRATEVVMELWHECKDAGLMEEGDFNHGVHDMLFNGQCIGAKLAGALNSICYDRIVDGGFVVAYLKRALPYFDEMMQAMEKVREQNLIDTRRLHRFSDDMFAVREAIIELMARFRNKM